MIYESFAAMAASVPSTSGVREAGRFTRYARIAERAAHVATGLIDRGISRGTPVGLLMVNGPELLTLAYAVFGAGGVVVPLNAPAPRAAHAWRDRHRL